MTPSKTVTRPYSDSFLLQYSHEHLFYEIDMLLGLSKFISKPALVQGPTLDDARRLANVIVEGFGIHFRNVVDFLYLDCPQPTDVVASDFCAPGVWENARPKISATLSEARIRVNKELTHLTTGRQDANSSRKKWEAAALIDQLKPILGSFVSKARSSALSPQVVELIL